MKIIKKNVYYCDHCKKKGLSSGAMIDRIIEGESYKIGNIQILPNDVNRSKYVELKIMAYEMGISIQELQTL